MKLTFEPDDLDILQGIAEESAEHLKGIEEGILKLEVDCLPELVDSVFRALHSVKGVASLVDFVPIKETAHSLESLLMDIRKGLCTSNSEVTDILLRGVDILNLQLNQLTAQVQELEATPPKEAFDLIVGEFDFSDFVMQVEGLRERLKTTTDKTDKATGTAALSPLLEQMLPDFIAETIEHLGIIEQKCVELEKCPGEAEILNSIMRGFHSIKGGAGVIASMRDNDNPRDPVLLIKHLTHAAETLVQAYRNQSLLPSSKMVDLVLQSVDKVTVLMGLLQDNKEADFFIDDLSQRMESLSSQIMSSPPASADSNPLPPGQDKTVNQLTAFATISEQALESIRSIIETAQASRPVSQKRIKQYTRALQTLDTTARYLHYDEVIQAVAKQLAYLQACTAEKDLISQEMLEVLRSGHDHLKQMLEGRVASIQAALEPIPLDYADKKLGEILVAENKLSPRDRDQALDQQKKLGEILVQTGKASPEDIAMALTKQSLAREKSQQQADEARSPVEITGQSIRVSQEKLDRLMNMIGELLISKNRIFHLANKISRQYNLPSLAREVKTAAAEVGRISDELQDAIMSARMVPLRVLFQRYPRTIRDISRRAGKSVELSIEGEDTELDKSVIEAINDPLVHMLRNAVDHGIELPEERQARGKNSRGCIHLSAGYQVGHVVIEIADDGGGLNPEQIKLKALKKGLIKPEQIEYMSNEDAYHLIFAPGFSTRDEVTELSGRGVGMDVVKSNIERLGGSVSVRSAVNRGTALTLKIPLSMSIIQGLIVEAAGQRFIIALDAIAETVKIPHANIRKYKDRRLADIRGEILPLLSLQEVLSLNRADLPVPPPLEKNQGEERTSIVVLNIDRAKLGLIVDRFQNQQEFVIKPLAEELASLKIYTGATILGDGSVVLILNPPQLLQLYFTGGIGG